MFGRSGEALVLNRSRKIRVGPIQKEWRWDEKESAQYETAMLTVGSSLLLGKIVDGM